MLYLRHKKTDSLIAIGSMSVIVVYFPHQKRNLQRTACNRLLSHKVLPLKNVGVIKTFSNIIIVDCHPFVNSYKGFRCYFHKVVYRVFLIVNRFV